jgi:hypothetical protein
MCLLLPYSSSYYKFEGKDNRHITITEDMLENTWREIDCQLDFLHSTKGANGELYFEKKKSLCST